MIIRDLTGEWPVYPGHPLVVATAIMKVFPTFGEANRRSEQGCCAALADSRIPGAGDHVGAAMSLLRLGATGASADAMIEYGATYWSRGQAGGHAAKVQPGQDQAMVAEPHFRALVKEWFKQ